MAVYAIVVYVIPVLFGLALSVMALFGIAISLVVTLCLSFIALFKTLFSFEDQVSAPSFLAGIRNFCLFGVLNRLPVLLKTYWGGIFNFVLGSLSPERGFASFCILTAPLLIAAVFLLVLGNVASLLFTALLLGCQAVLLPIGVVAAGCDFFLLEKPVIGLSELFRLPSAISRFFLGISFAAVALISSVYTAIVLEKLPYIDNVFAGIRDYLSGLVAGFSGIGSSQDPFSGITAFFQTVADTNHVAGLDYRSMLFSMAAIIVPPLILALISGVANTAAALFPGRDLEPADRLKNGLVAGLATLWLAVSGIQFGAMYHTAGKYYDLPQASLALQSSSGTCSYSITPFYCDGSGRAWLTGLLGFAGNNVVTGLAAPLFHEQVFYAGTEDASGSWYQTFTDNVRAGRKKK